jgi:gliding motility-associated-like protein
MKTSFIIRILSSVAMLLLFTSVYSQPQLNNWFFAIGNGINFSSGSPVNIPGGGKIERTEGSSTISDKKGNLLFYTDGYQAWDRKHDDMPNGMFLFGGYSSSTQSSLIVPKTTDEKQYYIFTADEEAGQYGLRYSIVDMTLNNGYGAITTKGVPLIARTSEKVTAIRHCNKKDYWIITHKIGSDEFFSFLASDTGVNKTPVISHTGSVVPVGNAVMAGVLKASPDGKKVIAQHVRLGSELMDFDNQTGKLSNAIEIFGNQNSAHYGAEFSANSSKLYLGISGYWDDVAINRFTGVFQYDLTLPTMNAIKNSKYQVCQLSGLISLGILARGPDKKIYMSQYEKTYLSAINSPDIYGSGCNFVDNAFTLPVKGMLSLNNGLNDYSIKDSLEINSKGLCTNSPIPFDCVMEGDVTSVLWNFGDPGSGAQNTSTSATATHTYTTGGLYTVKLIKYGICGNDTATKQINVGGLTVDLGADKNFCERSNVVLNPQSGNSNSFLWNDGNSSPTLTTSVAGLYWVQVSSNSNGCVRRDSIILTSKPSPFVNLGKDSVLCIGQPLKLDARNTGSQYRWQDNSTGQTFAVTGGGRYWVEADLNGCIKADTIVITNGYKPQFTLGPDKFLCPSLPLELSPGYNGLSYTWQDGSKNSTYNVNKIGFYYVEITNACGKGSDSINVLTGTCRVYVPSGFTPNNNGVNDYFRIGGGELVTEFDMKVFNRTGQIVFASIDKNKGWDGKLKGMELPGGVYVYMIKYKELNDNNFRLLKGTITLLR